MKIIAGVLVLLVSGIALFAYVRLAHEKPSPRPTEKGQVVEQMERGAEQARLKVKPIEDRFVDEQRLFGCDHNKLFSSCARRAA